VAELRPKTDLGLLNLGFSGGLIVSGGNNEDACWKLFWPLSSKHSKNDLNNLTCCVTIKYTKLKTRGLSPIDGVGNLDIK
jgi:hypothetical protein